MAAVFRVPIHLPTRNSIVDPETEMVEAAVKLNRHLIRRDRNVSGLHARNQWWQICKTVIHEQCLVRGRFDHSNCGARNRSVVIGLYKAVEVSSET